MTAKAAALAASMICLSATAAVISAAMVSEARATDCSRMDFVHVVEQASSALASLNRQNKPRFQSKLRLLRAKRKWTHDQFMKRAAPFVRDDRIAIFDLTSGKELRDIERLGGEGDSTRPPDCSLLKQLQRHMGVLVQTQKAKWSYMFEKIDSALTK